MKVIAWSSNIDAGFARKNGVHAVSKEELFSVSDFISVHLVLSNSSKGIIAYNDLRLMKPTAYFINTSRGPIVVEKDFFKNIGKQ